MNEEHLLWKRSNLLSDGWYTLPAEYVAEMSQIIAAQDSAGMEDLVQRLYGPLSTYTSYTFKSERTGITAYRSVAGVWSFRAEKKDTQD